MKFPDMVLKKGLNKLRTQGLSSIDSAKFGKVRNGGIRNHQGIDIETPSVGYKCYAICNGIVKRVYTSPTYGLVLIYETDEKYEGKNLYIMYAHLSGVKVQVGTKVKAGEYIAVSGDSGNAKGMDTRAKGSHVHVEVRTALLPGRGLDQRLDPLKFIKLDKRK